MSNRRFPKLLNNYCVVFNECGHSIYQPFHKSRHTRKAGLAPVRAQLAGHRRGQRRNPGPNGQTRAATDEEEPHGSTTRRSRRSRRTRRSKRRSRRKLGENKEHDGDPRTRQTTGAEREKQEKKKKRRKDRTRSTEHCDRRVAKDIDKATQSKTVVEAEERFQSKSAPATVLCCLG